MSNTAAWLVEPKSHPFQVKEAPTWEPSADEILVKNHAVAINPVDGIIQSTAFWPLNYPTILGHDIAGEVAAVGSNVTRFKPGDRVLGHAVGLITQRHENAGFQAYTIIGSNMASPIPDDIPYERAAVIPLGFSTAAAALFEKDLLNLQHPAVPASKPTGKTVLVWGGASSVGCNTIQLAVAAGYEVITTASAKNFAYVKSLGAAEVFDYNSPTVIDDLVAALKGKALVGGVDCIGPGASEQTIEVVKRAGGVQFVATAREAPEDDDVTAKMIFATSIKDNEIAKAVYEDFLPQALVQKRYVAAPEPLVVGSGLESIQEAVDVQAKGTSARKVVVTL
jgi:NADPH:quinone reductase-like Zn-dependent oxidoreductase